MAQAVSMPYRRILICLIRPSAIFAATSWLCVTNGVVSWNPSRPTGYGAVPDYRPVALANGADVAQSSAWRGHWVDITGYYNIGARTYDPVAGMWLSYDPVWNAKDPNYLTFSGDDPINSFDSDGRLTAGFYYGLTGDSVPADASSAFMSGYMGGGVTSAVGGQLFDEAQAANSPMTYINGALSYANNVSTVYQSGGLVDATSYALTSWNMGAVMSGIANQNQVTGAPLGDWMQQGEAISSGVAGTAGVAAGGLGLYNLATAPATTAPVADAATADATPASTPTGQSGSPLNVSTAGGVPSNTPSTISGIDYSGHALDQMQSDGIVPSAVQNTISQGQSVVGKVAGTTVYYEPVNNITVVTDSGSGRVVTVSYGQIKQ